MKLFLMVTYKGHGRLRKIILEGLCVIYHLCAFISWYSFSIFCKYAFLHFLDTQSSPSNIPFFLPNKSSNCQKPLAEGSSMFQ